MRSERHHKSAFSLIELMVVLVLIGLLAGLISLNVRGFLVKGKENAARADIATIVEALEAYYAVTSRYPTADAGLASLTEKSEVFSEPLIKRLPNDPWGNAYQYKVPGQNDEPYEVFSYGSDGRAGGDADAADIFHWQLGDDR